MVYADGSNPSVRKDIGVRLPSPAQRFPMSTRYPSPPPPVFANALLTGPKIIDAIREAANDHRLRYHTRPTATSTSDQRNPRHSPRRIPVVAAARMQRAADALLCDQGTLESDQQSMLSSLDARPQTLEAGPRHRRGSVRSDPQRTASRNALWMIVWIWRTLRGDRPPAPPFAVVFFPSFGHYYLAR
jgi:hypothetical protein